MARPSQEVIHTFTTVTGASESLALQKLEDHGGDLNEALNAHFGEVDRHITSPTPAPSLQYDFMDRNNPNQPGPHGLLPLIAAARSFKPSLLLDPNYRRDLYNRIGASAFTSRAPFTLHSGEVNEFPQHFTSGVEQPYHSGLRQIGDLSGTSLSSDQRTYRNHAEEEIIQAAIEASKKDIERDNLDQKSSAPNDSSGIGLPQRQIPQEDDISHAISLSLKTAEQEQAMREQQVKNDDQEVGYYDLRVSNKNPKINGRELKPGSSSNVKEQLPVSRGSNWDTRKFGNHPPHSKDAFHSQEWGEISPEELSEAAMLEAALFGGNPEGTTNRFHHAPYRQSNQEYTSSPNSVTHHPSPSPTSERLLREQQDDEYLASLLADREKEINALKEAETQNLKEDSSSNKLLEKEEMEGILGVQESSLPLEPALDDENVVTLLVRMPDGSRHGRRFLKSDKLQLLFDFIDAGRVVKSGTYRVVRPYPRRAFGVGDSSLTLSDLGLTSKQEALFLELI